MRVLFSPDGGCEQAIVDRINSTSGLIAGLTFMYQSDPIHNAILAACAAERPVYFIFDRRQQFLADPRLLELQTAGAIVLLDKHERMIRSQYLILEPYWILSGSYLYTYTSELRYAEVLWELDLGSQYDDCINDWTFHYDHSELLT